MGWLCGFISHLRFVIILLGILCASIQMCARNENGTINGTIKSAPGGTVRSVQLSFTNLGSGKTTIIYVGSTDKYSLAHLAAGKYQISASAPGFADTKQLVVLNNDSIVQANFVLVTSAKDKRSSTPADQVVNSQTVRDLPLNGRSASDVAALEPGVAMARTQSSGAQRGFGAQMTISGIRPRQNDSRLDGISVNDYSNGPPGSAAGVTLGVDAVQQLSVISSDYPAQYGRSSGGIIAASTRSGTDHLHGSVFEFLRNNSFDTRNFFDAKKPPFHRNQFGGTAGGPLWKSRAFVFVAYEGFRQSLGVTHVDTVPSPSARAGKLSSGQVTVDPQVSRFLSAFYPLPNGSLLGPGNTGIFTFAGQQVTPENYLTTRLDHQISDTDAVSGTYMFDGASVREPDELNNKLDGFDSRRQTFTIDESHRIGAKVSNVLRFGINRIVARTGLTFQGSNPLASDSSLATVPGQNAAGISIIGVTAFTGGLGTPSNFDFHWTSIQSSDDVSDEIGKHSLKFGVNFERDRDNILATSDPGGGFSFNSLADFLTNRPFSLGAAVPSTIGERGFRQTIFGSYIQDHWRLASGFTADLGLRYETASIPTEVHNKLTVLRHLEDARPHLGSPLFANPTRLNFEPRLGISWDPFRRGETLLSAGYGIFDVLPLPYFVQMGELFSAPYFEAVNATNLAAGSFPTLSFSSMATSSNTFRQAYYEATPPRSYVMQWNLTLQQQLAKAIKFMAAYVGSRGVHQPFRVEDADIVFPTLAARGYQWPNPVGSGARLNPNAGRITAGFWRGDAYYDALEVQLKKAVAQFQVEVSYTWSKGIDTSSASLVGDEYSNSISSPLWFDPKLNRGLSDFNIAQNMTLDYSWNFGVPTRKGILSWAVGGWELGGVLQVSSGVPFTPTIGGDALGLKSTDPEIDVPNLVTHNGNCASLINPGDPIHYIKTGCFAVPTPITLRGDLGRNTLIGPGLINFDLSLFKNNYIKRISDTFNAQFRAEFFNVLNHTNFAPPLGNRNLFDSGGSPIANAGLITSTQTPSRQIQFALKLIW
jgi:hypothetical protein